MVEKNEIDIESFVDIVVCILPCFLNWSTIMLKSYVEIAWRNIVRHKGYSAINISGMACSTLQGDHGRRRRPGEGFEKWMTNLRPHSFINRHIDKATVRPLYF